MSFSICVWAVLLPPLTKLRGGVIFSRLTVYPAYLQNGFFLPERRFVKFRAHGTLVCSRNKNAGWPWNLATKCGGVVHTEGISSPHLELMRIVRHADRQIAANGPSEGWGCLPRTPSTLLSARNEQQCGRKNCYAGFPPTTSRRWSPRRLSPSSSAPCGALSERPCPNKVFAQPRPPSSSKKTGAAFFVTER